MAVMKLEITEQRPLLGGKRFGSTGSYDMLKGRIAFAVDPMHHCHRGITDLEGGAHRRGPGRMVG